MHDDALVVRHQPWSSPVTVPKMAHAVDADDRITLTSQALYRDGEPWVPVSGEIHYSRVPRSRWRERLLLMRSGGIDVVSTYVIWIHHQPSPGPARFDDGLDVAAFVRLCEELGLAVVLRIGPWCHGEVRNGGFPDWVQQAPARHRTDDPAYLELVRPWYEAIAGQLAELCGPGGPIIGFQIENELYDQPEHLATLKRMARDAGLHAPLWTATAWGGAELPADELFPLYSGYGDGFWVDAGESWHPTFRAHFFPSHEWDDPGVGADVRGLSAGDVAVRPRDETFPPATCELGGGMATTYHRRPVPSGADIAAVANAKIASGSAWQGYYMYAGGVNPRDGVQESHATGYPNDLPRYDYDFHAAIGSAGQLGPAHAPLRRQHAFLRAFGPALAGMPSSLPEVLPSGVEDSSTLRWAVRSDGRSGFVFVCWHQPHVPLPGLHGARLDVELPERPVTIGPVDVPAGTIARWPFGLGLDGITVLSATASALTLLDERTLVMVAEMGIDVDIRFDPGVAVSGAEEIEPGLYRVGHRAGGELNVRLGAKSARIAVVAAHDADRLWVLDTERARVLALSDEPLWVDEDRLVARSAVPPRVEVYGEHGWSVATPTAVGEPLPPRAIGFDLEREASDVPASYGSWSGRTSAPAPEDVAELAAQWRFVDVGTASTGSDQRLLTVIWAGDVAQLLLDGEVVADRFWDGTPWTVDLDTLPGAVDDRVSLRVLPLHPDADVWLPADAFDRWRSQSGPLCALDAVTLKRTTLWQGED